MLKRVAAAATKTLEETLLFSKNGSVVQIALLTLKTQITQDRVSLCIESGLHGDFSIITTRQALSCHMVFALAVPPAGNAVPLPLPKAHPF